jgi:hypothetical protein
MYTFDQSLRNAEHTLRYSIALTGRGWEVREERDQRVIRRTEYRDWHRVERARRQWARDLADLRNAGWELEEGRPSAG